MSLTLRRELRKKFIEVLKDYIEVLNDYSAIREVVADKLADVALETAGIKKFEPRTLDWGIAANLSSEELSQFNEQEQRERSVADLWEKKMGYNPLPWWTDKDLKALLHFLMSKTTDEIETFASWSRREFSPLSPVKAREMPRRVIENWPQAFAAKEAEPSYYKRPAVLDEDESQYVIPD